MPTDTPPAADSNSAKRADPEAGKVTVTLAHPHADQEPGSTLKVDEVEARRLRRAGIAEPENA